MTKPQRKRLTGGKTRERVQAAGFSLTLFQDRNGVASVTAKVNTADDGREETPGEAGLPAFISGRIAASESRVAGTATEGVLTTLREWNTESK
ncbi:hypothetical protein RM02_004145 [Salmonella enterica subsp. enterica]|uniref:hypothetical protein n=1 Tax=Salmonella enterica TaxID=28901 RepID=UPI000FB7C111|nr:hypothetical protein [Salmonella enterica]EBQ8895041.1 hypothetical protein [Salmonella enterica subsp. enterica serovar Napoli]EBS5021874.1 hypothetical protein [Salmonella enterica subsp. enterica serovar Hvittingfoss]EBU7462423.1 hypothetical protein [Salmonella enterica subsp. enterica serovar Typhimurium]EBW7590782.1 hypothetical protein [Salmonella enterica subsp. salamae serovar Sofia]ECM3601126.1 hypothetical protein [Salmonella enterica subsp. enterica serovar Senftenberg]EDU79951